MFFFERKKNIYLNKIMTFKLSMVLFTKKRSDNMILKASEKQIIISIKNLLARNGITSLENLEDFGTIFFCSYKKDWTNSFDSLINKGIIRNENNQFFINLDFDALSSSLVRKYPRFRYWYNDWYRMAEKSEAHSKLCKNAYGIDLCQTGMMTLKEINYVTQNIIGKNKSCLDLGCGSGHISEYIADTCHSNVVGIDVIVSGIKIARERTRSKKNYLQFYRENMLTYKDTNDKFDYVFSFDTIYFASSRLSSFIENSLSMLKPDGKLLIFYSAWEPKDTAFAHDSTILGEYFNKTGINYSWVDFTEDERIHWLVKHETLLNLKDEFIDEGNKIVFDNRLIETKDLSKEAREEKLFRYLYIINKN